MEEASLFLVGGLLCSFPKLGIKTETQENQHSAHPLHGADGVGEEDHRSQDGEELPCCGDDGASQGTKVDDCHEDKALTQGTGQAEEQDVIDDGWIPLGKAQELPELPSKQDSRTEQERGPKVDVQHHVVGTCLIMSPHMVLRNTCQSIQGQRHEQKELSKADSVLLYPNHFLGLIHEKSHASHNEQHTQVLGQWVLLLQESHSKEHNWDGLAGFTENLSWIVDKLQG